MTPLNELLEILTLARAAATEEGDLINANMDWTSAHEELVWGVWAAIDQQLIAQKKSLDQRAKVFWKHVAYNFDDLPVWLKRRRGLRD